MDRYSTVSPNAVEAIFELDEEFNPTPVITGGHQWPDEPEPETKPQPQLQPQPQSQPQSQPQPQPGEKSRRPPRPRLDIAVNVPSISQLASEETPRPIKKTLPEQSAHLHLGNHNRPAQSSSQQNQAASGASTQVNNGLLSPLTRRPRRRSIFQPRTVVNANLEVPTSVVPTPSFTSPLAQLFSPIITEPPDGGFHGPNTAIGQRRAARRSAGDAQLAPGVAQFRHRAIPGLHDVPEAESSALSTTPRETASKEPSETVSNLKVTKSQKPDTGWVG